MPSQLNDALMLEAHEELRYIQCTEVSTEGFDRLLLGLFSDITGIIIK
jgi:hypothetical protein